MNAEHPKPVDALRTDEDSFINLLLAIDPKAAYACSKSYAEVKRQLIEIEGWELHRVIGTVHRLANTRRIFLSNSKRSISLIPVFNRSKKVKRGTCVYCGAISNRITRDHVRPKSQGGTDDPSNIVQACLTCNHSKADRTPEQWAADVLRYRCRTTTSRPAAAWATLRAWAIQAAVMVTLLVGKGGAQ